MHVAHPRPAGCRLGSSACAVSRSFVALQGDRLGLPLHVDADAAVAAAVDDAVVLQTIAVRRERLAALGTEQDADLAAAA